MAILDGVDEDQFPVTEAIDFNDFTDGTKYSTVFKELFEINKDTLGITTYEEYIAYLVIEGIKQAKVYEISVVQFQIDQSVILTSRETLMDQCDTDVADVGDWTLVKP